MKALTLEEVLNLCGMVAYCQESPMHLKRCSTEKLREIFNKYATQEVNGDLYMTSDDFVRGFLGQSYNEESVKLLAGIADTSKDGLISFAEFQAFEGLLCTPDALYKTAFQLFDRNGNGSVTYSEFVDVFKKTDLHAKIPFKLDGPFIQLYFGKDRQRTINYAEFSQFLHDFHEECALEAFRMKDTSGSGFISALDFQDIMVNVKKHLLTADVKDNLVAVTEGHKVSFPYFMAFNSLLNNMELIKRIYLNATSGNRTEPITKDELLQSAQTMSQITPLEIDILFQLTGAIHQTGRIVYGDLSSIAPEHYTKHITTRLTEIKAVESPADRSIFIQMLESTYRFTLGSVAGGRLSHSNLAKVVQHSEVDEEVVLKGLI